MALVPIKQLDGPGGYLRWKESVLLRVHTIGVGPGAAGAGDDAAAQAAAKKWARDDVVCRGHVLATLSVCLLPDYARFATAADLWRALARTYDLDTHRAWRSRFDEFEFDEGTGDVLMEQIAHAEALGVAARLPDDYVADALCGKLPEVVGNAVIIRSSPNNEMGMGLVWGMSPGVSWRPALDRSLLWKTTAMDDEDQEGCYFDGPKPEQNTGCRNRVHPGPVARNIRL